jgi:hypothetical protein
MGLLQRLKVLHIKLDKPVQIAFRKSLIDCGVTMQEAISEFARLVGEGDHKAMKIVEAVAMRHVKEELGDAPSAALYPTKPKAFDEQDHDALYSLISGEAPDEPTSRAKHGSNRAA